MAARKKVGGGSPPLAGAADVGAPEGAMASVDFAAKPVLSQVEGAAPTETLSYRVLSPLHHDGAAYTVGDLVTLDAPAAAYLIGLRVVAAADEPAVG